MNSATQVPESTTAEAPDPSGSVWSRPVTALLTPRALRVALWVSVGMVTLAIVLPLPTFDRAVLGLAWLAPLTWIPRQLERIARRSEEDRWVRSRRYHRLRGLVVIFIEEVKRLNWLSVDERRGLRDRDRTRADMDQVEENLRGLISEIREAAGVSDGPS